MIRINLLPKVERPSREAVIWEKVFVWSLIGAALILILGVGFHIFRSYEIATLKSDISESRIQLKKYEGQVALVRDLTEKRKNIENRISIIENLDRDRSLRVYLLDELARSVPEYIWLASCDEKSGNVTLKGMAFSNLAISQFMDALGSKAHVDSVYLKVIRKDEIQGQPVLNFELGYRLKTSERGAKSS